MIECIERTSVLQASLWKTITTLVVGRNAGYFFILHASILKSFNDLLTEIISLTNRLNWWILNFSFFSSSIV